MIKILKAIHSILSNDAGVTAIVDTKIFPNIVPDKDSSGNTIEDPVLVMRRSEVSAEYSKDCKTDDATVTVTCFAASYFQAVDLADAINTALEFYKGTVEGISISAIRLVSGTEDYVESSYFQQLVYSIR